MILNIEKLIHTGYGLARDSKVYFVPFSIPGEKIEATELTTKKNYAIAKVDKILIKSPYRIEPKCEYFGVCGGCQLQHIDYDEQLNQKALILKETFFKIGKIDTNITNIIYDKPYYYRNRARFKVKNGQIGYVGIDKDFVAIEHCPILSQAINSKISFLKEFVKHFNPSWISLFYSDSTKEYLLKFASSSFISKEKLKKFKEHLAPKDIVNITLVKDEKNNDDIILSIGSLFSFVELLDIKYRVSINSFFQTNLGVVSKFLEYLEKPHYDRVLDDYGGVGLFGLQTAKYSNIVEIADKNKSSCNDAEYSAKLNKLTNVSIYNQSSFLFLKKSLGKHANLLILDPPRSGLSKEEIDLILLSKPDNIWYISCEPSSLARDLSLLSKTYKIKDVYLLDMFPQTYHIESFIKLELL